MAHAERAIEVGVPVRVAYDQWTQFDQFPRFMEGVEEVVLGTDGSLDWHTVVGGRRRSWKAQILEQVPDRLIQWRSIDGGSQSGIVRFQAVDPGRTRLNLWIHDGGEVAAGELGRRIEADLLRFRSFIEGRHGPTGAWRWEIHQGRPTRRMG
jgi:uncharacterized membrane protein